MSYYGYLCHSDELYHHGVKGMKWGIRKKLSNAKSFLKSKKGKKALAISAGIGAATTAAGVGSILGANKIINYRRQKAAQQRQRNADIDQWMRDNDMLFEYDKFEPGLF